MKTTAEGYHVPVMLQETMEALRIVLDGTYVDVTFGGGGHSRRILELLGPQGRLYAFDQDQDALANVPDDERLTFVMSNFRYLKNWMRYYGVAKVDGILADLGVSSHHFDEASRGFSFREDGPLDMRMNRRQELSAAEVLNTYTEKELTSLFRMYGELKQAHGLASAIKKYGTTHEFHNVSDLMDAIGNLLPAGREKKDLAKIFQALRIEVNHEMSALKEMLTAAPMLLREGGRLVVLTYHSLEDRMTKNVMRSGNVEGQVETDFYGNRLSPLRPLSSKVTTPSPEEMERNPRSRSAKLRVAERVR